ncbi:hypothetical protein PSP6_60302 [Paraburkholderia tropica]|nr:hypothetical protein PSP6_60302 [Paraburkholderia tropica]
MLVRAGSCCFEMLRRAGRGAALQPVAARATDPADREQIAFRFKSRSGPKRPEAARSPAAPHVSHTKLVTRI